jgi:hypothetical protein
MRLAMLVQEQTLPGYYWYDAIATGSGFTFPPVSIGEYG